MPRHGWVKQRESKPDLKFNDILVAKIISIIMKQGRKSVAEGIFYGALDVIKDKTAAGDPVKVFRAAMDNVKPAVEVKARRVGGASYQVPVDIRTPRRNALAIRWLIQFARERTGRNMAEKLASEIIDAANGIGGPLKKKEGEHRSGEG